MTFEKIIASVTNVTGETNEERLALILDYALKELWLYTDIPGSLWKVYLDTTGLQQQALYTLPNEVYVIRKVRYYRDEDVQLGTPIACANAERGNGVSWELTDKSPLQVSLDQGGPLVFGTEKPLAEDGLIIRVEGSTETASRVTETLEFPQGFSQVTPTNAHKAVTRISKSSPTSQNIAIKCSDKPVGTLLNYLPESPYQLIRVTCPFYLSSNILEITYKVHPPCISPENSFDEEFSNVLIAKAIEYQKEFEEVNFQVMAEKAAILLRTAQKNARGQVIRKIQFRSAFTMYDGNYYDL
jgi:hypothetical protein